MDALRVFLPGTWSSRQRTAALIIFVAYLLATQISINFFTIPAVIVPGAGLALAALVLEGIALWPALYGAALISLIFNHSSLPYVVLLPIAQTLEAILGAYILKMFGFDPLFRKLRDMFLIIVVALTTAAIVPTLGTFATEIHTMLGSAPAFGVTWSAWWIGHVLSLLIVAPFLIRWIAEPLPRRTWLELVEIVSVFIVLLVIDYILGWVALSPGVHTLMIYLLLVPLSWLAIRLGPRYTFLGLLVTTLMLLTAAFYSTIPASGDLGSRVFQLEIFIDILAFIFYIIVGLQEERAAAVRSSNSYINKLEEALNRLSLQDRAKTDFIAILAHELRNPLAPIVSALELLKINHSYSGEEAQALNIMDSRLKTIQHLLDDLLDVSRISRSKLRLKKERVDLRPLIEHSIRTIDRNIKEHQQTLVIDLPSEPMVLDADPVRIEQIVTNLLTNATKFTSEGGRIVISLKREGDTAIISVADNGIGIDPKMQGRIFDSFLQLEAGEHRGEGLGIGLSLTHKLVEMHGGTIEAKSEGINRGSEFVVRLPLLPFSTNAQPRKQKQKREAFPTPLSPDHPRRILVVDDNVSAAQGIGKLLEHKGYEVLYAYNAAEAKEKVESEDPQAIVLDIGLPDMDGYDLARMLREDMGFPGVLIALTGYGQEEDKQRAFEAGFDHHLTKPIGIAELEEALAPQQ